MSSPIFGSIGAGMHLETFNVLRSATGQALLAELAARNLSEVDLLRELTRLRAHYPPDLVRAAVEQTLLRRRAQAKFSQADRLYFTREALEQASNEAVATHRARRLAGYGHVADICCGIGGDLLALAAAGPLVTAVDRDELRLALAAANAAALGVDRRVRFICADALSMPLPPADALFCDPGRRAGGRRRIAVEQYEPPLARILAWQSRIPALAVKLGPGVNLNELPHTPDYEVEFVSLNGELKEATLWCGPLATTSRRATVLQQAATSLSPVSTATMTAATIHTPPRLAPPGSFLYEPDPAIIRAGLVTELATQLNAAQLDADIAYLTADQYVATPFARIWRVLEWLPFNLKRLRARLREFDAGAVTVKKRGSPLDTDTLARQLSGHGARSFIVVLTHTNGHPVALICTKC